MLSIGVPSTTGLLASAAAPALLRREPALRAHVQLNIFNNFLKELDNFVDDAANRRLGNGAKFYGKRKSSFYGEDDPNRKADPNSFDREEDYSGPAGGSYFVLSKERDEQGRPMGFLTRKQAREQAKADEVARLLDMQDFQRAAALIDAEDEEEDAEDDGEVAPKAR